MYPTFLQNSDKYNQFWMESKLLKGFWGVKNSYFISQYIVSTKKKLKPFP